MEKNEIGIIGGAGFVGSFLSKELHRKNIIHKIYDINNYSEKVNYLDVERIETFKKLENTEVIVNLAAVHRDDIKPLSRYDDVNVFGAENVCKAARKNNINKIIFTSSVAIYGFPSTIIDESGKANYFNDYGRTKYLAELEYKKWQAEDPENRTLVIIRPTVIFGPGNRGNVYNLLKQVASKRFLMIGNGKNKKSMAYVENVAAFLEFSLNFKPGLHIYNYIDEPDFDMNSLIMIVRNKLFNKNNVGLRLPVFFGRAVGFMFDILSIIIRIKFPISSIRIKKFIATTQFSSSVSQTKFNPPVRLIDGLEKTINYEFLEDNSNKRTFETE